MNLFDHLSEKQTRPLTLGGRRFYLSTLLDDRFNAWQNYGKEHGRASSPAALVAFSLSDEHGQYLYADVSPEHVDQIEQIKAKGAAEHLKQVAAEVNHLINEDDEIKKN